MALVDYSSSSGSSAQSESADEDDSSSSAAAAGQQPPSKRRRRAGGEEDHAHQPEGSSEARAREAAAKSEMPPLPSGFHDLYASGARQSVVDDPGLHQGRKRQTPHVAGMWPTHLYVEYAESDTGHPSKAQHASLMKLMEAVKEELGEEIQLFSSLTSDLGAPMPLHISLSRPLTLSTAVKDEFLDKVTETIRNSNVAAFSVSPCGLAWYRSPDSDRTFLIMRVLSSDTSSLGTTTSSKQSQSQKKPQRRLSDVSAPNPEFMTLLTRCNSVSTLFNQAPLYQSNRKEPAGDAFHVSIGWTFGLPLDERPVKSLKPFKWERFAEIHSWNIAVAGIKAKIGNVVNHISLEGRATKGTERRQRSSLFDE